MKQQKLLAAILCAASSCSYAADDNEPLPILVVTGTRIEQPLQQSLSDTAVITRQQIEDSHAVDVAAVLKQLAGVEFYQSGGTGMQSSLFLRGGNSSHVLVLVDGVRINSATTGTTAIDQLMLDQIDHIEVVRGNVSSLYGSEAIGGVIQIFTRRGKGEPSFNASAGIQTHNTRRFAAGFGGEAGNTAFNLQASRFATDGVSAINPEIVAGIQPDNDGYDNTSFSANARYALSKEHGISFSALNSRGNNQYDQLRYDPLTFAVISLTTDKNTNQQNISKYSLTSEDRWTEYWQSKLQLAQGADDLRDFLDGVEVESVKTINRQASWQNTLSVGSSASLLLGLERLDQKVDSTGIAYTQSGRKVDSAFAGYSGYFGAHQVQANVRQDRYSDFGAANTWSVSVGHALGDAWRAAIGVSTAFKAPTFNDMYGPASWGSNPDLVPERSRNHEAGLHYAANGQSMDIVYFSNHTRDLIVYQWPGMVNLDESRNDGVEFGYAGEFGDTGITAAVTSQNPRDTATGEVLLRRAKSFGNLGLTQQLGALKLGGEWQYSGKRADYDINTFARTTLAAYSLVNLTASYALGGQFDLAMRVDNLFDRNYMLAHGYNTLGRTVFVGLNYQQ
ncbi:MAG TPA: TonB-dependent receptor [Gallionella sp.]